MPDPLPSPHTLQRWALDYVQSRSLAHKLSPPSPPESLQPNAPAIRVTQPGRPPDLHVTWDKVKTPGRNALRDPQRRAALLHTFLHHELQAAELMCFAVLAYPDTPAGFRRGLIAICQDEIRHMAMYARHIRALGFEVGGFPVRDWFWARAPAAQTPGQFCALMGVGFEAGNLDHCARFERLFREVGDEAAAELTRVVREEEVAHVAFGAHWFAHFEGPLTFERWRAALPAPLSPMVMRGRPLNLDERRGAGLSDAFLEELQAWQPTPASG